MRLSRQDFPKGTANKDAIIASRKPMIKDLMDALSGLAKKDFADKWLTDDMVWEDPLQRYEGREEVRKFVYLGAQTVTGAEIETRSEHHGVHEVLMDWTVKFRVKQMPNFPMSVSMQARIMLEPPSKAGGAEKIFKYIEDWGGAPLLNEKTTVPILGKIHARLRRFHCHLGLAVVDNGLL